MEVKTTRIRPVVAFMAFGTKGDVYPIAAIAAAFTSDRRNYEVIFVTHSAHHELASHLAESNVKFASVLSAPIIPPPEIAENDSNSVALSFCSQKSVFSQELPLLYQYLQEAPGGNLGWRDVIHWMWPLFSEDWGSWSRWRGDELNLSPLPFTDPMTDHPMWHKRPLSPLLLYGFSREVVDCPDYWPSNSRVSGFWFLQSKWQFSCRRCRDIFNSGGELCSIHSGLNTFINVNQSVPLIFIGLSSAGNLGFLKNPGAL